MTAFYSEYNIRLRAFIHSGAGRLTQARPHSQKTKVRLSERFSKKKREKNKMAKYRYPRNLSVSSDIFNLFTEENSIRHLFFAENIRGQRRRYGNNDYLCHINKNRP
ncbi:MAG: hypothetical protein HUK02_08210 [Bacteroidaceae bacterium]|nr:hypothetical protein [Bacteroidaceae bacterium]